MKNRKIVQINSWLRLATDKSVLQLVPILGIILNTTFIHLVTSVDIGFERLAVRIPIAVLSVLPLFGLLYLAHLIAAKYSRIQIPLVMATYLIGGMLRGFLLEFGLRQVGLLTPESASFRIFSGLVVVTISAAVISYVWAIAVRARVQLQTLRAETQALQEALSQLSLASVGNQLELTLSFANRITDQLRRILGHDIRLQHNELDELINNVIKPLSKEYAQGITRYQVVAGTSAKVKLRDVWFSIDPIKHLPAPAIVGVLVAVAGTSSLVGIFGLRNAIELISFSTPVLLLSLVLGYSFAKRYLSDLKPPMRDVVITLGFFLLSIPPAYVTQFALADTNNPTAYVLPGIIMLPIFGWLIMTGNAGWQRLKELNQQLSRVQARLKWSIARSNLLSWYYQGMVSRLLHGPIQNSVQVTAIKMASLNDPVAKHKLLNDVITRIDEAIQNALLSKDGGAADLLALTETLKTWQGVAEIKLAISPDCNLALTKDAACASILVDLIQEYCSNAIRHGRVKKLEISLALQGDVVQIVILKDTRDQVMADSSAGLGTEFITACTIDNGREALADKTRLTASVPIELSD